MKEEISLFNCRIYRIRRKRSTIANKLPSKSSSSQSFFPNLAKLSDIETLTTRIIEASEAVPIVHLEDIIQHSMNQFEKRQKKKLDKNSLNRVFFFLHYKSKITY
ncbi:hypothetical protein BDF21DRAFT_429076 [Thamnidium elegans]|nr:hypothetical protein BDF21DRAFT_429076 [Thamnidium elegans]